MTGRSTATGPTASDPPPHPLRTFSVFVCVLVATLVAPVAIGASWLMFRVDSTDAYVDTVAPLADQPTLRAELADRLAVAAVGALEDHLPVGLPEAADARAHDAAVAVIESPDFPEFWREANADAHREFLRIVHDERRGRPVEGYLTIDLSPLLGDVFERMAAAGIPIETVPEVPLRVPVVEKQRLAEAGGPYRLLEGLGLWLPLLWLVLVGLAVLLAHGWRGRLRTVGFAALGPALAGALVGLVDGPATDVIVDEIEPDRRELVRLFVEVILDGLDRTATGVLVVTGLLGVALLLASFVVPRSRKEQTAHARAW